MKNGILNRLESFETTGMRAGCRLPVGETAGCQPALPDRAAAFTQVELLVLVGVVGVLAMVGLSASVKISNQTKIAQCSNNLRELNLAHLLYAADNSDNLPSSIGTAANWLWDVPVPVTTALVRYGVATNMMYCPGTAPRFTDVQNFAGANSLWNFGASAGPSGFRVIGYALTLGSAILASTNRNSTIVPQPITGGPAVIPPPLPSQRVLTADANLSQDGVNFTSIPGGFGFNGVLYPHLCPHLDGTFPAGGNVGMLDGHVEWRPFKQMQIRTTAGMLPYFYW